MAHYIKMKNPWQLKTTKMKTSTHPHGIAVPLNGNGTTHMHFHFDEKPCVA